MIPECGAILQHSGIDKQLDTSQLLSGYGFYHRIYRTLFAGKKSKLVLRVFKIAIEACGKTENTTISRHYHHLSYASV